MDGAAIATDRTDLLDGSIGTTIELDEAGARVGDSYVLTGTLYSGLRTADCAGYSDATAGSTGMIGRSSFAGNRWTQMGAWGCYYDVRLYCFED